MLVLRVFKVLKVLRVLKVLKVLKVLRVHAARPLLVSAALSLEDAHE
jgi:hypothetical protein